MASFGKVSRGRLKEAKKPLQILFERVVARRDCAVMCGFRGQVKQDEAYFARPQLSKVRFPNSKHNKYPTDAVDVTPWPEKWDSIPAFKELAKVIQEEWTYMTLEEQGGYDLRWGGDWDSDGDTEDETFVDMPHWELVKKD